jgi:hypothetical protein
MQKRKLRLEDLTVESFLTSEEVDFGGTVRGHADGEVMAPGTIFSICRSCDGTCDEYTCKTTCPPLHTCIAGVSCAPEHTCVSTCPVGGAAEYGWA